jgi:hypothetical protein
MHGGAVLADWSQSVRCTTIGDPYRAASRGGEGNAGAEKPLPGNLPGRRWRRPSAAIVTLLRK